MRCGTDRQAKARPLRGVFPELPRLPKRNQTWDHFWSPQRRLSGVRRMRKREINESGEKATGAGIIFGKRKGVIRPLGPRWVNLGSRRELQESSRRPLGRLQGAPREPQGVPRELLATPREPKTAPRGPYKALNGPYKALKGLIRLYKAIKDNIRPC